MHDDTVPHKDQKIIFTMVAKLSPPILANSLCLYHFFAWRFHLSQEVIILYGVIQKGRWENILF